MKAISVDAATIPAAFFQLAGQWPDGIAQLSKDDSGDFRPTSFATLANEVRAMAGGLHQLGVKRGQAVGLIADNRKEWLIADLAILSLGACDVPRGTDTMPQELQYILDFSACQHCLVENVSQLAKIQTLLPHLPVLQHLILLDPQANLDGYPTLPGISVWTWSDVMSKGQAVVQANPALVDGEVKLIQAGDIASVIFTSGTTGEPKGVMLTHDNFLHQVRGVHTKIDHGRGDVWLCILPVWHSFERVMQYLALLKGSTLAYSKPVAKVLMSDLAAVRPTWMAAVPRVWDSLRQGVLAKINSEGGIKKILFNFFLALGTIHAHLETRMRGLIPRFEPRNRVVDALLAFVPWLVLLPLRLLGNALVFSKIKERLGGRFKAGISGGGALAPITDDFYQAAGICVLEGYGLTESAPVISVRTRWRPVPMTVGSPLPGTEVQVRADDGTVLPPGQRGVLHVRGAQVMKGYLKKPLKTREVISPDGWLNTGDLAVLTHDNEIRLVGRAKDTIVLSGGENVEPQPLESRLLECPLIAQAMVVGQDQKFLGALIVPNQERLIDWARQQNLNVDDWNLLVRNEVVVGMYRAEITRLVSANHGFRAFEQIARFALLAKAFEVGKELSGKQDLKRHYICDVYAREIEQLFGGKA